MPDLNANDIEAAMKMVEGTARSMGIEVRTDFPRWRREAALNRKQTPVGGA